MSGKPARKGVIVNKQLFHTLVTTLELVQHTATQAWWHGRSEHCGSDFSLVTCEPCFAFEQCKRHTELAVLFAELHRAVD